jgi:hypothetical protein
LLAISLVLMGMCVTGFAAEAIISDSEKALDITNGIKMPIVVIYNNWYSIVVRAVFIFWSIVPILPKYEHFKDCLARSSPLTI